MTLITIDGPPGTGKTRRIIQVAENWEKDSAVLTYTNDAAAVVRSRAPDLTAGTIYSLSWPHVSSFAKGTKMLGSTVNVSYGQRKIHHLFDPALVQYEMDAPSNCPPSRQDGMAKSLHAWSAGDPPFDLWNETPKGLLKYTLPLARWVEAGCPLVEGKPTFKRIAIDEAQDMSWLELRACLGLLKEGGEATAYGDPGQSIFATSKGMTGGSLPPVWASADEKEVMNKGYRVGDPVASVASRVLSSYYKRPSSTFKAEHVTDILTWNHTNRPFKGLVLGYSRRAVAKAFRNWNLSQTGVVPNVAQADEELVLATGHAAKGAEADDVYLLPWSRQAIKRLEAKDTETIRLLYVMLTRARRRVHIPITLKARLPQ
jgi:hypothetical protein|tara:strand:- start:3033 stop:4148 length:1116 start_codon:yes stop_codon:yes gene_type:complete